MPGLFSDPYRYVLDSSALFDLKRQYPKEVFKGVWLNFENMIANRELISVREVRREIEQGSDWLKEWAEQFKVIFSEPSVEEQHLVREIQVKYPYLVKPTSDRPNADPFVIASAIVHRIPILTHEKHDPNKQKIPMVAQAYEIACVDLPHLFLAERWEF